MASGGIDSKSSTWSRPRRRLRRRIVAAIAIVVGVAVGAAILFSIYGHTAADSTTAAVMRGTAKSIHPARRMPKSQAAPPVYRPVPATAPIFSDGRRLPRILPAAVASIDLPILQFHSVDVHPISGPWGGRLTISTARFEAEVSYLAGLGYHPLTLEQAYAGIARLEPLPKKPVALTFDDGYLDDYTVAFPILRAHHFVATFFVITGAVGKPGYVTWADLRAMHAAGMAIESHTVNHRNLDQLPAADLASELATSRAAIAAEVGQIPAVLAYPGGDYDPQVAAATKAAGYLMAVTTHAGKVMPWSNPYAWPRVGIGPKETVYDLALALEGKSVSPHVPRGVRPPQRPILGLPAAPRGSRLPGAPRSSRLPGT